MPDWKTWLEENLDLPPMAEGRDRRIVEELADHLEELHEEAVGRGASPGEAEEAVKAWLGDPADAKEQLIRCEPGHVRARMSRWAAEREEILREKGGAWMPLADLIRDLRLGLQALRRRPAFTGVVILVLALGIGATVAIFTLVDAVVLSPLPFPEADRLVAVQHAAPGRGLEDVGQCAAWHFTYLEEAEAFEDLGMFTGDMVSVTGQGDPEALPSLEVTSGVFRAIGLTPIVGRIFTPMDEDPDGPPRIMLSEGYWQTRFGGDPGVVGQTLEVDGTRREIIGVAPMEIRALGYDPAVISLLRFRRASLFVGNIGYDAVARLRDGVTLAEASADLTRVFPMAWEKFPGGPVAGTSRPSLYRVDLRPLKADIVGPVADLLWILLGGVSLVLLIACANVANLFLVRSEGRNGEMAVRVALGASRSRITWEYLKESLLLGGIGGLGGLFLAHIGLRTLLAMAPSDLPRLDEVSLNGTVLFFAVCLSLGAGVFFGLFPLFRWGEGQVVASLKEGGRAGRWGRKKARTQNLLVVIQMALALVLLVSSGLMIRSFQALRDVDPGFRDPDQVLALRLYIPGSEVARSEDVATTFELIVRRLEQIPGVSSVGLATAIPMDGSGNVNPFLVQGRGTEAEEAAVSRRHKWIGPKYLEAMEIPLLMGRTVSWDDIHARAPVALLSETLAREVFGSPEAAMGQRVAARPDPPVWKEVIGIVADVREDGVDRPAPALVYWPHVTLGFWEGNPPDQVQVWRSAGIAIRSARIGSDGFLQEVQSAIWEVSPNLPLIQVRTVSELMAGSLAGTSFTMILLGIAGVVALILGLVGVYGVIAYGVSQRTHELGMRAALGASSSTVMGLVLRQGLSLAAVGIGLGLMLAMGVSRVLSVLLHGVSPDDPLTYSLVAIGLLVVALLASYLPARRAAKADPMRALRAD